MFDVGVLCLRLGFTLQESAEDLRFLLERGKGGTFHQCLVARLSDLRVELLAQQNCSPG
jgi:hypothetical protein